METAIPEYCPDMARIVDTVGQLRLREKHLTGQQLTVSGSVVLTVLYTSEESTGLRSLSMEVPFSCQVEDKRLMGCAAVCVVGRLLLAEARAVTARKLYLRVMPEFTVSGYANRRQRLCCGVGEDPALRVRRQETELELLTAVEEREFSFTQEAVPEGPPPEDVLMEQAAARVEECRRVGSRLVVKGQAEVCVLYRGDNQELAAYRTALPFSQLLDGLDLPEDADVVRVSDARQALAQISAAFFGFPQRELTIIGVTGTKGKTTVAETACSVMNRMGLACGVIGSNGAAYAGKHVGTSNTTPESYELMRLFRACLLYTSPSPRD